MSHYDWLEENLPKFFEKVGIDWTVCSGIVSAHGDKGRSYKSLWDKNGISFEHGMAVFLLTYIAPYDSEPNANYNAGQWVVDNFYRFKDTLEEIDND